MSLACPNCKTVMTPGKRTGVNMSNCHRCYGLWIDHEALGELIKRLEGEARLEAPPAPVEGPVVLPFEQETWFVGAMDAMPSVHLLEPAFFLIEIGTAFQ